MKNIRLDRRQVLLLSASAIVALPILPTAVAIADELNDFLLTRVEGPDGLRLPAATGKLSADSFDDLYDVFSYVLMLWEMDKDADISKDDLREMLALKSMSEPSYFTEYMEAVRAIRYARLKSSSPASAYQVLILGEFAVPSIGSTRLGRLRQHVLNELVTYAVVFGGFRKFGLANYRGFMGGPFTDPDNPPFRVMEP